MTIRPTRESERQAQSAMLLREQRAQQWAEAHPQSLGTGLDRDPITRREAERLNAEHDPTRASACRFCGKSTSRGFTTLAGWKVCRTCTDTIDTSMPGRTSVWRVVLGEFDITRDEADAITDRLGEPCYFAAGQPWPTDEGSDDAWAHIADIVRLARDHLRHVREQSGLTRSPSATGCARCGLHACIGTWMDSERHWPDGSRAYICALCVPSYDAAGGVLDGEQLLADVIGVRALMGVNYGIKAFIDSRPADITGTEDRFTYLAEVAPELRRRFVRENPRYATPDEAAEIEAEKAARAAEEAARPVVLADL
jgi:hypothetical protein